MVHLTPARVGDTDPHPVLRGLRARAAERAIKKSITEYERRIAEKDTAAKEKKPGIVTPELAALRARRDALQAELKAIRDSQNPKKTPEEIALQTYKTRTKNEIAKLRERIAKKEFSKKARKPIKLDAEAVALKAEIELAKREFHRAVEKDRLEKRTRLEKIKDAGLEVLNLPRALKSGYDLSAVLRQGMFFIFHPEKSATAFRKMLNALMDEKTALEIDIELRSRPMAALGEAAKLELTRHGDALGPHEEAIRSRLSDKIPGMKASNRAFTTFLNVQRAQMFDSMVTMHESRFGEATQKEMESYAEFVNIGTGRGQTKRLQKHMPFLSTVLWSPKLLISRFQMVTGSSIRRAPTNATRLMIAREYARFGIGMAIVYTLFKFLGADIEKDPRSSDFGKIRFGDTRIDPLAGLSQATVFLARMVTGEKKTGSGKVQSLTSNEYKADTRFNVFTRFVRSKLSPVIGMVVNLGEQKNVVGEPVTPMTFARDAIVPLSFQDIQEAMEKEGIARGSAIAILPILGWGMQTYETGGGRRPRR